MNISTEIKERILEAINVFETGSTAGEYDNITIYADGKPDAHGNPTRQITFGRSQTTEQGHLKHLVQAYIDNSGTFASQLAPYLPKIGVKPLVDETEFINTLKKAAQEDDIMRTTQDAFFDKHYFQPAVQFAKNNGFTLPLSMLVIYDSYIHSGGILDFLRKRFPESPPKRGGDEKAWTKAYTQTRHNWLLSKGGLLAKTTYRTECFTLLMVNGEWMLQNSILANGTKTRGLGTPTPAFEAVKLSPEERKLLKANAKYAKRMRK